jgi:hypothetical protein
LKNRVIKDCIENEKTNLVTKVIFSMSLSPHFTEGYFWTDKFKVKIVDLVNIIKDNPEVDMPLDNFTHILKQDVWGYFDDDFDTRVSIYPNRVIAAATSKNSYHDTAICHHIKRIEAADLSYPILFYYDYGFVIQIIDGVHRLAKAHMENKTTIRAKIVSRKQIDQVCTTNENSCDRSEQENPDKSSDRSEQENPDESSDHSENENPNKSSDSSAEGKW